MPRDVSLEMTRNILSLIHILIDAADHNGEHYLAVVPYVEDPEKMLEEDAQLIIMRVAEENGEEFLDIVEDDEELAAVSEVFAARLEELYDIEL